MSDQDKDRADAAKLPEGDVVAVLLTQHATVRDMLDQVKNSTGGQRQQAFNNLTAFLKAHETAEESVIRPVTEQTAGASVVQARNAEETHADDVIAKLKTLDVASDDFETQFAEFTQAVSDHAEAEEHEEFPTIIANRTEEERHALGHEFLTAFASAEGTSSPGEDFPMTTNSTATLYVLGDRGQTIAGSANDVRGRQVTDMNGETIGKVADLLVDETENKVRFMVVEHGGFLGFGETKSLIPVEAVTQVTEHTVHVNQSRERIATAPGYTPDLVDNRPYHASLYDYYGYPAYWGGGYLGPMFPPLTAPH